jgi:DNA primase
MAGRIRDEDIAAVRDRSKIDEIIGEHVQLGNAGGGNLKGICPFHDEKSPSLSVSPARGLYHCFGCSAGGDVIKFVQDIEHLSFTEAVESLASRAGIQLRYAEGSTGARPQSGQRARLVEANRMAEAFYIEQLSSPDAGIARDFLTARGFDAEAAAQFRCGFAPTGWDALSKHLMSRGFSRDELTLAGLAKQSQRGTLIDRFRGRLLWPIRDVAGDVVGFGARRLTEDDQGPKYLNTPETPIYKKSQLLYGMDVAKREIAKQHKAVVVEGYTDVMACHLAGVTTAVATCGTSFGTEHIGVLRRMLMDSDTFTGKVIFTFDGDSAGKKAAERAFGEEQRLVAQTSVAIAPEGQDPCELRLSGGDAAVRALIDGAVPLVRFVLQQTVNRYDLSTSEGRTAALDASIPQVAAIKDHALRDDYARRLAGLVGIDDPMRVVSRVRGLVRSGERGAAQGNGSQGGSHGAQAGSSRGDGGRGDGRGGDGRGGDGSRGQGSQTQHGQSQPQQGQQGQQGQQSNQRPATSVPERLANLEREVIKAALQLPDSIGKAFDDLGNAAFMVAVHQQLQTAIAAAGGAASAKTGPAWIDQVSAHLPPESEARGAVNALAVEPLRDRPERQAHYAAAMISSLAEKMLARQIAGVEADMRRFTAQEDHDGAGRLSTELMELKRQQRELQLRAIGGEFG